MTKQEFFRQYCDNCKYFDNTLGYCTPEHCNNCPCGEIQAETGHFKCNCLTILCNDDTECPYFEEADNEEI